MKKNKTKAPKKADKEEKKKATNPFALLLLLAGISIVIAGFYFLSNDLTTSGPKMGKYGNKGTATMDGSGLLFSGGLIILFAMILILPAKKKKDD